MKPLKFHNNQGHSHFFSPRALICWGYCSAVIDCSASWHFLFSTEENAGWAPPYCDVTVGFCLWSVSHCLLYIKNEKFPGALPVASVLTGSKTSVVNEMGRKREETWSRVKTFIFYSHAAAWMPLQTSFIPLSPPQRVVFFFFPLHGISTYGPGVMFFIVLLITIQIECNSLRHRLLLWAIGII